ncbi:MAG: S8 family serine peptidase, partial [Bacteroidales bacterium]
QQDIKKSPGTGNQAWWGGNYGEFSVTSYLAFVAPTVCYTTASGGGYNATFNGTSAACPNAAGVAALVLAVNPALTSAQVYEMMARGADKIDNVAYNKSKTYGMWNDYYGYGRLNAYHSVRLAATADVTPPTIVHQNIKSHSSTYPTTITATIVDQDATAVPATGSNKPILFYRHKLNGGVWSDFDSARAVSNSGSVFNFKIPGFGHGTEVQYYLRARDAAGNETTFPKHAQSLNPYTLCFFGIGQIIGYSAKTSAWSFDNAMSNSPVITVPGSFNKPLVNLSVQIFLRDTWINDVSLITLWSPDTDAGNNRKAIWGQNYASSNATTFGGIKGSLVSDTASAFWKNGYLASGLWTGGSYKPDHPFQGLMGIDMAGNWKFTGRDLFAGDIANFDSIRLNLTGLDDILSACAKHDTPIDTIAFFLSNTSPCQKDFYIKSTGNADLSITGYAISGDFASKFTLLNTPASTVAPGDSSLYSIAFDPLPLLPSGNPVVGVNAVLTILTNDPSKANFRVSLQNGDSVFCINPVDAGIISSDQSGCSPFDPSEISVTVPSGHTGTLEYQWQSSPDNTTFTNLSTGTYTATTYDPDALSASTWFRRLAKVTCESVWASSDTATVTIYQLPTAAAGVVTNVNCFGGNSGAAEVSVSGGRTSYSYAWSSDPIQTVSLATSLTAGEYYVTVTDVNGCSALASATVNQPDELTASAFVVSNISIYEGSDGSVTVSSGGGTTPYSYAWSCDPAQTTQTASGLTTGTYWVTVTDANSCSATSNILVTQPTPPTVQVVNIIFTSVGNTQARIDWTRGNSDGCAVFIMEGNTGTALPANNVSYPPNTVFGTPASQVGSSGWYCVYDGAGTNVTVTGLLPLTEYRVHICEYKLGSKTYNTSSSTNNPSNFTTSSSVVATASVISNVSCFGFNNGSATVSVSGGNLPYSYLWSCVPAQTAQTAIGLYAGTYTVTVTDGASSTITSSISITEP